LRSPASPPQTIAQQQITTCQVLPRSRPVCAHVWLFPRSYFQAPSPLCEVMNEKTIRLWIMECPDQHFPKGSIVGSGSLRRAGFSFAELHKINLLTLLYCTLKASAQRPPRK
jgi:hypothetical protein